MANHPFVYDFDTSQQNPQSEFDKFNEQADSTMTSFLIATVVLGVVSTIATVAIVFAIIDCLRKAGSAIPQYARLATSDNTKASPHQQSANHIALSMEPEVPANQIQVPQTQFATIERFLSNIGKEKPIRFSPQQIEEMTNNCSMILGSGGYGVVFKGELQDGVPVAVKVLTSHSNNNRKMEEQFMAEIGTIGRAYHAGLVTLYGFCFDPSMMALVYEYMVNGSLNKLLFDEKQEIEWEKLEDIAIGTAKAIAYLHEDCKKRIIHYDIKPENILLDHNLNPKVADFGLAQLCNRESSKVELSAGRGTLGYSAPEIWNRNYPVTHKCDVYSFGVVLFEIVGRRRQFDPKLTESRQWLPRWAWDMYKNNELEIMVSLCGIEEKNKEKACRMCNIGLLCIQYSPDARPLMSDVVKMLEGSMEILQSPQNPFPYLETTLEENHSDSSMSAYGRVMSQILHDQPEHGTPEIELAAY